MDKKELLEREKQKAFKKRKRGKGEKSGHDKKTQMWKRENDKREKYSRMPMERHYTSQDNRLIWCFEVLFQFK